VLTAGSRAGSAACPAAGEICSVAAASADAQLGLEGTLMVNLVQVWQLESADAVRASNCRRKGDIIQRANSGMNVVMVAVWSASRHHTH
jgi:hypothetical protein